MKILIISPININLLPAIKKGFVEYFGNVFPIIKEVLRIAEVENYAENFGRQWNIFDKTQHDNEIYGLSLSLNNSL